MILEIFLIIIVGLFVSYFIFLRIIRKLIPSPAPAFIGKILDSNLRRKIQSPEKVIQRSGIKKGMQVLEIGCGSGAFTTFVAQAVGPKGNVYALDIQQEMLQQLENKLSSPENKDITNIKLIESSAYDLPFDDKSIDLVFMVTVIGEIPDNDKALKEIKRVLKPGGILAITETFLDPDYLLKSTLKKKGEKAGFNLDKISGSFWHYTIRFN
ncbi:MAG: methyltransferase domain-containing protein [Thermoplasmatales archaeon]|nr:MAG: methyltransferase domain-containing protein [Thermoplasmatales archaeon]